MVTFLTTIPTPTSITESFVKAQIRTPFEDGSVQSRVKHTRGRGKWDLNYDNLTIEESYYIRDFFYTNQGDTFTWINPMDDTSYTVRFTEDELKVDIKSPTDCSMTIKIEEA